MICSAQVLQENFESIKTTGCVRFKWVHKLLSNKLKFIRDLKGSTDQSHFIFEINVGKKRIRYRTALNLNDIRF